NGGFAVRPDTSGSFHRRNRVDRTGRIALYRYNETRSARNLIGYRVTRQESRLTGTYTDFLRRDGKGGFVAREWTNGHAAFKAELGADWLRYRERDTRFERWSGHGSLGYAQLTESGRFAVRVGQRWVEDYDLLPFAFAMYLRETDRVTFMASAGYSERAPSQHELHHTRTQAFVYGFSGGIYADKGNPSLKSERQLTGSVDIEYGDTDNALGIDITGGHIKDGIDWVHTVNGNLVEFVPENGDIDFVSVSGRARLRWRDFLRLNAGGAYNYTDYALFADRPYTPDYQVFTGGELHVYWRQKLVDLYAYGEMVYVGPYTGYLGHELGNRAVFNAVLSFRMGKFRFHYVFQNVFNTPYRTRERF
ncbi:MAG: hypothetical protein D6800_13705, partial [Candidatus Zixiibacteriota bacterium]